VNLPNQLTVARLILTLLFVATLSLSFPHSRSLALILFATAALTDFLDGYVARRCGLVTNFGKLMDPVADKVLMCAGFVMMAELHLIPGWVIITILAREFLVTGLRLIASAEGKVLAAEGLGKHKTTWQIVTLLYFLLFLASAEPAFAWMQGIFRVTATSPDGLGTLLIGISLVLTIWSGLAFALKNRALLLPE
jgi:CDP-diacylglycerol---glycerol-3-phosphate 3-phosphatidyltransferase